MDGKELHKRMEQFKVWIYRRWPHLSPHIREDAASWAVIKWLEGSALKQDFKWLFIDYLRTGMASGLNRNQVKEFKILRYEPKSMERLFSYEQDFVEKLDKESLYDLLYELIEKSIPRNNYVKTVVCMYFLEEKNITEIARHFDLTDGAISLARRRGEALMRNYANKHERFARLLKGDKL